MPLTAKLMAFTVVAGLVAGAVWLMAMRGSAMILDLATGAAAFICL